MLSITMKFNKKRMLLLIFVFKTNSIHQDNSLVFFDVVSIDGSFVDDTSVWHTQFQLYNI